MPNEHNILDEEQQPTASEELYKEHATPEQSFEDFCDYMVETFGKFWVYKFNRKSRDK